MTETTLLTLALTEIKNRSQWHSSEQVTIWQAGDVRAWVKNQRGWLVLVLFRDAKELASRKYSKPLGVGYFDPQTQTWEPSATVVEDYPVWVERARIDIGTTATGRKSDALTIARRAGATHRDARPGHGNTFYRVSYPQTGRVGEMTINGRVGEWKRSRYDYAPEWSTVI